MTEKVFKSKFESKRIPGELPPEVTARPEATDVKKKKKRKRKRNPKNILAQYGVPK